MSDAQVIDQTPQAADWASDGRAAARPSTLCRRLAIASLWHHRHRARRRPAGHSSRLDRRHWPARLPPDQGGPGNLCRSRQGGCQGPCQRQFPCFGARCPGELCSCRRDRQAEDRCGENPHLRCALISCATMWSSIPTSSARPSRCLSPFSDPFDQLYKGVIPKEVDRADLEPGALFRAAAESRCGGR